MKRGLAIVLILFAACAKRANNEMDGVTQDGSGRRVIAWIDPMYSQGPPHNYKSKQPGIAPDCGMKLIPQYAEDARSNAAMPAQRLATAEVRDLSQSIRTTGRVAVDERRTAQVRTKIEGFVDALYVNFTGQQVRRGEPLLAIYSPDLLATENDLILAQRNHSDLGRTLADAARTRLRLWDVSDEEIDRVTRTGKPMRDVILRSPASGVVTAKNVTAGARVMPSDTLYEVADLSRVWVLADVYESQLPAVRMNTRAQVTVGGQTLTGIVTFVGPVVSAQTRTATVRIELDNRGGLLKPDMFADVTLQSSEGRAIAVPDSAVMNTGTRTIVFVARADGSFETRQVQTGARSDGFYAIRSGLQPGERVAVDANFLIDSESRLRGGAQ